ncbi:MAG: AAA family ATPase [Armatimonadetes bacterium]|nr:AAA family ATPase [Armatimonadota bacterium]
MLLRLRVRGFKNLKDVDIRFGPLTCFVGVNGVGKSNVLDAIQFLRALTEHDMQTAARLVRSPVSGEFGPRDLFFGADVSNPMSFVADMLVPRLVVDDFGREAEPATTLLRYEVEFGYVENEISRLVLNREVLKPMKASEAGDLIGFNHRPAFRRSVVKSTRRKGSFISTAYSAGEDEPSEIKLHQDGGSRGQAFSPGKSPRTVVGGTNAAEYPTVLAARREMSSWQILQLEPSVIRTPDRIGGPTRVDEHGGHVAAALDRLVANEGINSRKSQQKTENQLDAHGISGRTLGEVSNRLATLVEEVRDIQVNRDDARQQLTVMARLRGCKEMLGPRSLSDGTLRFLALVTMLVDRESASVLCMEEPENGMHPKSVPSMVRLLEDFAVDPDEEADPDNPLRQIIVNTHSPDVVRQLGTDDVLFVDHVDTRQGRHAIIRAVEDTWRTGMPSVPVRWMIDFVGGSPVGPKLGQLRLPLELGTVR